MKTKINPFKTGGHFGSFGGRYVPEMLIPALEELEKAYLEAKADKSFKAEFESVLKTYSGRPTPLYFAGNLTKHLKGAKIYLKQEGLGQTGSHKINNAIGQAILAKENGKETRHCRDRRRPARACNSHCCCKVRISMRNIYGAHRHQAPAA